MDQFSHLSMDTLTLDKPLGEIIDGALVWYDQYIEATNFDFRNWSNHPFSDTAYSYLCVIMNEIDSVTDYGEFLQAMQGLYNLAKADTHLTCHDFELISIAIEVAKNSVYLWMPKSFGGMGVRTNVQRGTVQLRFDWRAAARADAESAAVYFHLLAWGIIIPGTNAAIATEIAIASGLSSALAGL